jgi:NAD(P)-dependent dehydrogenase (short-subunit alcohol dehydrogenase family)
MAQRSEVVVITGASAGVGRATARRFARDGTRIALVARGIEGLEAARDEVRSLGGDAIAITADVADADAVERAAEQAEAAFGPIDIWINNAMTSVFSPVQSMTAEEYRRVTEVTYLGYVYGTQAALRRMQPRDRGTIVQVGSALAYRGIPLQSAYCGAKHAVRGFTDSLRCELWHDHSKIQLTMVQLPALNTPQFEWVRSRLPGRPQPVPPIFQPEVAADAVYFAAHHHRRELLVGGSTVLAVLAAKFVPGIADRYLGKTGYDSQQTTEPAQRDAQDDLWEPVPGDHGARGSFDDRASDYSAQLWATTHRGLLASGVSAMALGAAAASSWRRAKQRAR